MEISTEGKDQESFYDRSRRKQRKRMGRVNERIRQGEMKRRKKEIDIRKVSSQ